MNETLTLGILTLFGASNLLTAFAFYKTKNGLLRKLMILHFFSLFVMSVIVGAILTQEWNSNLRVLAYAIPTTASMLITKYLLK